MRQLCSYLAVRQPPGHLCLVPHSDYPPRMLQTIPSLKGFLHIIIFKVVLSDYCTLLNLKCNQWQLTACIGFRNSLGHLESGTRQCFGFQPGVELFFEPTLELIDVHMLRM